MNRKYTREAAMKLLFQVTLRKEGYMQIIDELKEIEEQERNEAQGNELITEEKREVDLEGFKLEDLDMEYVINTLKGIEKNLEKIDSSIQSNLVGWKLSRLANIDRAILRIGTYEILFNENIPDKVSINEAIELSKKYCENKSPAFINAVLDKIAKNK